MSDAPRVAGLAHLRRIIGEEIERAKREGMGCLYLEGCLRAADRALVDDQVRPLVAADPLCRLLSAQIAADGYLITVGRVAATSPDRAARTAVPLAD